MKFSVLMSLYDKESPRYYRECLESLASQSLQADEVVVVFDGPISVELKEITSSWTELLNIKVVKLNKNMGLSYALNFGLSHCRYDYVARMDTDDICLFNRFEEQIDFLNENPSVDICGSYAIDIDGESNELKLRKVPILSRDIRRLIWTCPIIHPSVIFRKESILAIGSYRNSAPHRQDDYDLWIRAVDNGLKISNIAEPLLYYRYPMGSEKKNTFSVGLNRFKLGIVPLIKYDFGIMPFLGLCYPMFRALLPSRLTRSFGVIVAKFDPRNK
ncbi:glycosyltransferase [Vibrio anguillarum]|uniref:Glycosyltransferase n=2 Tax=Vibrio anguillarum TaxID=55601 RepID=A0ABR9ZB84_VIBAN|nr:glycosyltransferase [Vibrio anguillarum]